MEGTRLFPGVSHRQLYKLIDRALEEARSVRGTESLLDQVRDRALADFQLLALPLHLTLDDVQIQLGDLLHFIFSQWRENHDLVNAIAKLGRESLFRGFDHLALYLFDVGKRLRPEPERLHEFLKAV